VLERGNMWPTMEEVEAADQDQLCMWHRFLSPPRTKVTLAIEQRIFERWCMGSGLTAKLRKQIGWARQDAQ
jgi:hypothetical protein